MSAWLDKVCMGKGQTADEQRALLAEARRQKVGHWLSCLEPSIICEEWGGVQPSLSPCLIHSLLGGRDVQKARINVRCRYPFFGARNSCLPFPCSGS